MHQQLTAGRRKFRSHQLRLRTLHCAFVAPDCGLKYLPRDIAFGKMCAMVEGAKIVRRELAKA
jgi:methionine synthase II (cobalamin-independent)